MWFDLNTYFYYFKGSNLLSKLGIQLSRWLNIYRRDLLIMPTYITRPERSRHSLLKLTHAFLADIPGRFLSSMKTIF